MDERESSAEVQTLVLELTQTSLHLHTAQTVLGELVRRQSAHEYKLGQVKEWMGQRYRQMKSCNKE